MKKIKLLLIILSLTLTCKKSDYVFTPFLIPLLDPNSITESKLEDLVQISNSDYNLNENGIVTQDTIIRWWNNWNLNRPNNIRGKLILLHIAETSPSGIYLRPKEVNGVYSYLVNNAESIFRESRFTGVFTLPHMLPTGGKVQNFLREYNINPTEDLIVLIPDGSANEKLFSLCFRIWHILRYWGIDHRNLAVLNGGRADLSFPANLVNNFLSDKVGGSFNLPSLRRDNTVLQTTNQDIFTFLRTNRFLNSNSKVYIIDARTNLEFTIDRSQNWAYSSRAASPWYGDITKFLPMEGRINPALNLPSADFLEDIGSGKRLKSFNAIQNEINSKVSAAIVRSDRFIVYSRNGIRSSLVGFILQAVVGYPTSYYNNGWTEWSLSSGRATQSSNSLPFDSPWRTDFSELTQPSSPFVYNADYTPEVGAANVQKFTILFSEAFSRSSDEHKKADKAFINNRASSGATSLPSRPGNPCG